jgi:hypothetical protein
MTEITHFDDIDDFEDFDDFLACARQEDVHVMLMLYPDGRGYKPTFGVFYVNSVRGQFRPDTEQSFLRCVGRLKRAGIPCHTFRTETRIEKLIGEPVYRGNGIISRKVADRLPSHDFTKQTPQVVAAFLARTSN